MAAHQLPRLQGSLATLEPAALAALEAKGTWNTFGPRDQVMSQGTPADRVHVVASGTVRIVHTRQDGHKLLLGVRGPGAVLGELSVIEGSRRSASVVALDDVVTMSLEGGAYLIFLREQPEVMFALLGELGHRLRTTERRLADVGGQAPRVRLARQLLEHALSDDADVDEQGHITMPLDASALAQWISSTPGEADDAVRELQRGGLLRTWGGGLRIVDVDGLRVAALM